MKNIKPAIWFLTVRTNTGSDKFTEQLVAGLKEKEIQAEVTWLPHYAEYLPWLVPIPQKPHWANIVHINTWLHPRFLPSDVAIIATLHHCVQDQSFIPYKTFLQNLYHQFWITPIEKHSLKVANAITTVSQYTAKCAKELFDIDDFYVIHNGIDHNIFYPNNFRKPVNQDQPFKLLFVGSSSIRKGFDLLPQIMEMLGDNFQLFYTSNAEQYKPLPKNMIQLPHQKTAQDLAHTYRTMDALIFPSRLEGFGLVVAEAMACGLPVIVANSSALPELIVHGHDGFLCPPDNTKEFVFIIKNLRDNPYLAQAIGLNANKTAMVKFNYNKMINSYIDLYQNVLKF